MTYDPMPAVLATIDPTGRLAAAINRERIVYDADGAALGINFEENFRDLRE